MNIIMARLCVRVRGRPCVRAYARETATWQLIDAALLAAGADGLAAERFGAGVRS